MFAFSGRWQKLLHCAAADQLRLVGDFNAIVSSGLAASGTFSETM